VNGGFLMHPGHQYPQRDSDRLIACDDHMAADASHEREDQRIPFDRLGPRLDDPVTEERRRATLGVDLGTAAIARVIKCATADAEAVSRFVAAAVVVFRT
jgi:hypothetical protein